MEDWVYFAGLYPSKFEAYCAVMWIEADERIRSAIPRNEVQVYQSRTGKYGVRFRKAGEL
ncbi:hypothetical protein D2Q93_02925 [Alicyclobacillaceae bacterium I2511]|nr:hypothetical protein D2Q93_02925 [Alicyclobacillaceae bacterium I2511]